MTPVALLTCVLALAASAVTHVVGVGTTRREIAAHRVVGDRLAGPIALALPVIEIVLAGSVAWALLTPGTGPDRVTGLASGLLFLAFAGYLALVLRRGRGGLPCACGLGSATVGGWTIARAATFGVLAGVGALAAPSRALLVRPWSEVAIIACAAVTFAIAISLLPTARHEPSLNLEVAA